MINRNSVFSKGSVIASVTLVTVLSELDEHIWPAHEPSMQEIATQLSSRGLVRVDAFDVEETVLHLYEQFAGAFIMCAINRGIPEKNRAMELQTYLDRISINSVYIKQRQEIVIVYDFVCPEIGLDRARVEQFKHYKHLHELNISCVH